MGKWIIHQHFKTHEMQVNGICVSNDKKYWFIPICENAIEYFKHGYWVTILTTNGAFRIKSKFV